MKNFLEKKSYNPYIAGASIGILSWITILFMGKTLGTTTSFAKIAMYILNFILPTHVASSPFYVKFINTPIIYWQSTLVIFVFFGAMVSSNLGKSRTTKYLPDMWKKRFGSSRQLRNTWAFIGGVLLAIGARIAGGCTSGHGISGGLKLALAGWIFVAALFSAAIITATLMYRSK